MFSSLFGGDYHFDTVAAVSPPSTCIDPPVSYNFFSKSIPLHALAHAHTYIKIICFRLLLFVVYPFHSRPTTGSNVIRHHLILSIPLHIVAVIVFFFCVCALVVCAACLCSCFTQFSLCLLCTLCVCTLCFFLLLETWFLFTFLFSHWKCCYWCCYCSKFLHFSCFFFSRAGCYCYCLVSNIF